MILLRLLFLAPLSINAVSMFQFTISCTASTTLCTEMTNSLVSAGNRIQAVLQITVPITVSVTLQSFGSGLSNVLGSASPGSLVVGRLNQTRPFTTYAQAIVKQLNTGMSFTGFDIAARFNSDFNFYFKSSGIAISASQYDFEYVASHELTHGLGFTNDFYTSFSGSTAIPTFMIPSFYTDYNQYSFQGWTNTYAFTSYMWDYTNQTFIYSYFNDTANNFNPISSPLNGLDATYNSLLKTQAKAGASILAAALSSNLKFVSEFNSTPISLFSPSTYSQGSSIAHTDYDTFIYTPDFLMCHSIGAYKGQTLDNILSQFNYRTNSIYGPSTIALMSSIGWNTYMNTNSPKIFYPDDLSSVGSTGSVGTYCWPSSSCLNNTIAANQSVAASVNLPVGGVFGQVQTQVANYSTKPTGLSSFNGSLSGRPMSGSNRRSVSLEFLVVAMILAAMIM